MKKLFIALLLGFLPLSASAQVFSQYQVIIPPFVGVIMSTSTANGAKLQASTSPTVSTINATSTLATSTLAHLSTAQLVIGNLSGFLKAVSGYVTTAAINLASDVTGLLPVANGGTGVSTFTSSQLLYGNGTNALSSVATTALAVTAPITFSGTLGAQVGGATGNFGCTNADTSHTGCLTSTDWNTFNGKGSGSVTSIATNNGVTGGTITTTGTIGLASIVANSVLGNITGSSAVPSAVATSSLFLNASASNTGLLTSTDWNTFNNKGSGTVTAISVASANGFAGSSSGGATPALTLTTSITGLLKGNGTAISAASNGSDFTLNTAKTCNAGDFVSAVTAAGVFTCTTPSGTSYTGTWPIIITGSVISFGGLSTSTNAVVSNIPYFSGVNTFANVATTTVTAANGLTGSITTLNSGGASNSLGLAAIAANSVLANKTSGSAVPTALATSSLGIALSDTTGTLAVNRGGTGATTLTGVLKGNGTSAFTAASNGTDFTLITGITCTNQVLTAFTAAGVGTCATVSNAMLANSTISGIALGGTLGALTATNSTLTFSGSYTGASAQTVGLNLANPNTWTGQQIFNGPPVGVASSTPFAQLSVGTTTSSSGLTPLFGVSSSTNASIFSVLGNGNVGIGSSSPNKLFLVEGNQTGGVARIQRDFTGTAIGNVVGTYDILLNEAGSGSLLDAAGPAQTFSVSASGGTPNIMADIVGSRNGADTSGQMVLRTYNLGTAVNALTIDHLQRFAIATSTSGGAQVTIASSTGPQLDLVDGSVSSNQWIFRNAGGTLYISTSSPSTFATSTPSAISITSQTATTLGVATSSPWRTLSVTGTVGFDGLSAAAGTVVGVCFNSITKEIEINTLTNCTVSSRRYKNHISYLTTAADGLSTVMALKPASFIYNGNSYSEDGFIAEDVAAVAPQLAGYDKQGLPSAVDDIGIDAQMVLAIQQQQAEIEKFSGAAAKSAEDDWQWIAIALLFLWNCYNTFCKYEKFV